MSPTPDTFPRVGWSSPPRMPSSVDFPQPDGPTMARISPWRMVKLTSSRTDSDPYWWLMSAATSSKAIRSRGRGHCGVPLLEQKTDIAGQDLLARRTERADVLDEIADRLAGADLLGIIGGEHDARGRDLHQRRLHRADRAAETGRIEHEVAGEIVIEILLRL